MVPPFGSPAFFWPCVVSFPFSFFCVSSVMLWLPCCDFTCCGVAPFGEDPGVRRLELMPSLSGPLQTEAHIRVWWVSPILVSSSSTFHVSRCFEWTFNIFIQIRQTEDGDTRCDKSTCKKSSLVFKLDKNCTKMYQAWFWSDNLATKATSCDHLETSGFRIASELIPARQTSLGSKAQQVWTRRLDSLNSICDCVISRKTHLDFVVLFRNLYSKHVKCFVKFWERRPGNELQQCAAAHAIGLQRLQDRRGQKDLTKIIEDRCSGFKISRHTWASMPTKRFKFEPMFDSPVLSELEVTFVWPNKLLHCFSIFLTCGDWMWRLDVVWCLPGWFCCTSRALPHTFQGTAIRANLFQKKLFVRTRGQSNEAARGESKSLSPGWSGCRIVE